MTICFGMLKPRLFRVKNNRRRTNFRPVAYAGQLKSERAESKVKRSFAFHESLRSFRNFSSHVSSSTHYLSPGGNIISKK